MRKLRDLAPEDEQDKDVHQKGIDQVDRKVEDMITDDAVPAKTVIEGEGEVGYEAPGIELVAFCVRVKIVQGGDNGVLFYLFHIVELKRYVEGVRIGRE